MDQWEIFRNRELGRRYRFHIFLADFSGLCFREYPQKIWPEIWYSTFILGSWNSHWMEMNNQKYLGVLIRRRRKASKKSSDYQKNIAYRNVCVLRKPWEIEVVRCMYGPSMHAGHVRNKCMLVARIVHLAVWEPGENLPALNEVFMNCSSWASRSCLRGNQGPLLPATSFLSYLFCSFCNPNSSLRADNTMRLVTPSCNPA